MLKKKFAALLLIMISCDYSKVYTESPLSIVVKLNSAELLSDPNEALKYIDVDKVYSDEASDTLHAIEIWKNLVFFKQGLNNSDHKFTGCFQYHDYKIIEKIEDNISEVIFVAKSSKATIQEITYTLEKHEQNWIIIDINYLKK